MAYTKTHYYMFGLLAITVLAFWPSYFSILQDAPLFHHLHGVTGTLWILLIALQSFLLQSRRLKLHRAFGKLLFILVPVMVGAFALVTWLGAQKSVGGHPFYEQFGHALLTADVMLTFTTPLMIYLALRYRKNMHVHGALMITTVFGLLPPILSRLIVNYVPGLEITDLESISNFAYGLYGSMILCFVLAFYLYFRYRAHGWPWMFAAIIIALMFVLFETVGQSDSWTSAVNWIATLSPLSVLVFGLLLGVTACIFGWFQRPMHR